ncbi:MAG TPA: single-stranded-DNA-specific exonuclease RecJ [Spirochaetia bacterium]|nr:single-stranded-DNA-specific exonuclease RecJ [Spirochaetaceae bacterium]HPE88333.1 single-stranded-DNA-specific exonuclease RecJ [Spirochaetales bacterium]HRW25034.1 single-stranded-DNA-specific exonuclease RecJ [Spirochaetia bacterium]
MRWKKRDVSPQAIRELAERFGLDLLSASVLARRGVQAPEDVLYYLEDDLRFQRNPFLFSQMEDAVDRILLAADEGEKVLVFGDRDADGVSATTLMMEALASLGVDARYRLPTEDEKYGLSRAAVDEFAADYGSLIVTVDCGISNHAEIAYAAEKGVDVIVVDHHVLQADEPPPALAVIDPKIDASGYPFRDLSGCGVAYKLAWALRFAKSGLYKQQVALLNVRPVKDAYVIEALRLSNLVETGRVVETIVPGMVELERTRLVPFLKDRQIFVWDGEIQKRLLAKALGKAAEVNFYDVRPDVGRVIPQAAGASLVRLSEMSKIGKYSDRPSGELDAFANLFVSFALRKAGCYGDADAEALQLVALSTIADLMPLRDENRLLVRQGLAALNRKPRKGLAELVARQNLTGKRIGSTDAAWQLTPVINAAGRMGKPEVATRMLLSDDAAERGAQADALLELNQERRRLGAECWDAVYPAAREAAEASGGKYVIIGRDDLFRGITGIVASRLADTFKAPAVAGTFMADGTAVASVRSARGFNVKGLLEYCSELFYDYGGHDAAAGFSLPVGKWPDFERMAAEYLSAVDLEEVEETVDIDAELPHEYMAPSLSGLVDRMEPFGEGNPALVFMARSVAILQVDIVGKQEKSHLKLLLDFGAHRWPALWWNAAERYGKDFDESDRIDLAFRLQKNYWNGQETPQLVIVDARKAE